MRGVRNVWGTTVIVALTLAATALGPAASASAQASAGKVTIKVIGISRTGATVAVDSNVEPPKGNASLGTGPTYHVKPGIYYISGDVPTPTSDPNVVNQTLVVRKVDVRKSGTIALDSRGGRLLSVRLNGKELSPGTENSLQAGACDPNEISGTYTSLNGPIYVKPTRIAGLTFVWGWHSGPSTGPGPLYDITGLVKNSVPAHPVFRVRTAQLVKTDIQVRSGAVGGTSARLSEGAEFPGGCGTSGIQETVRVPSGLTVYRSPASWPIELDTFRGPRMCGLDDDGLTETLGHPVTIAFGAAARGPGSAVPFVQGKKLSYDSQLQFIGTAHESVEYCYAATVTLASGGHVIARRPGGMFHVFNANVAFGRWYTLTTKSRQVVSGVSLSPRTTLAWRFKLAKGAAGGVPVAVTSLVPKGLDLKNRAAPGSKTAVRAVFTQDSYALAPRPDVPVRSFTVQASFNDGKTWHRVAVVKHKGFWTFVVHNPSSGFVTLRTTTVNTHGNSSVETIYRAYGIR
jgi:hypothetical protein